MIAITYILYYMCTAAYIFIDLTLCTSPLMGPKIVGRDPNLGCDTFHSGS